jgi:hypothetical protein
MLLDFSVSPLHLMKASRAQLIASLSETSIAARWQHQDLLMVRAGDPIVSGPVKTLRRDAARVLTGRLPPAANRARTGRGDHNRRLTMNDTESPMRRSRRQRPPTPAQALRDAIAPYIAIPRLRRLVAERGDLYQALRCPTPPQDVLAVLELLRAMLQPDARDQIKSPTDAAGLLVIEMSTLDQEQFRTLLLDTKNRVLAITTVYVGSLNTAMIRVGEVFKSALAWNSAALIVVHNHPSGDPTPSPEDVLITDQIVAAGKLLDVDVLDHLVIGHGRYCSMREKGLGFTR